MCPMDKNLVGTEESAGVVIHRCSVNKVFSIIVQNSQENICAGSLFNDVSDFETCNFIIK